METGLKLTRVLPEDLLARLNLRLGDTIFLTESPDGYRITPDNPDFERQYALAKTIMKRRRSALRELAK